MNTEQRSDDVQVKVTFPISQHGPFQSDFSRETLAGTVLGEAMTHFEVQNDPSFTYELAHDGHEVDPNATIGSIAEQARALQFTLIKKITQG